MQANSAVAELDFVNRRQAERYMLDLPVRIGPADAASAPARLRDLSTGGFRAAGAIGVRPGADIWLRLAGQLPVKARLIWSNEGMHGAAFAEPLSPGLVRRMVEIGQVETDMAPEGERAAALVDLLRRTRAGEGKKAK